jgi:DNA-binding transcriptional regulator YhcF (GntR family)
MSTRLDLAVDRQAETPLGAQLAERIRSALRAGRLAAGDRLPSVRELAQAAGVNVNTARAVYARLESEGIVSSEQGRGTFVRGTSQTEAATRRELREQIAQLEMQLARLPMPPATQPPGTRRAAPTLLSTDDLESVRNELFERLSELETERAVVLRRLRGLELADGEAGGSSRRATPSLAGARVRWVGA